MAHWKATAKLLFGLSLLTALLLMVDHRLLWQALESSDAPYLFFAFILFASQGIFECFRLKIMFSGYGIGFADAGRLFLVGMFFSNFMPGMFGADVYQVQQMHAIRPGLLKPVSLSLYLRLSGVLVNVLLAVLALFAIAQSRKLATIIQLKAFPDWLDPKLWISAATLCVVLAVIAAFTRSGRAILQRIFKMFKSVWWESLSVIRSLSYASHAAIVFLGILVVSSRTASTYALLLAVGIQANLLDVLLAVTVSTIVLVIPISVAGLGVHEVSLSLLLIAAGVEAPAAVAVSLLSRCFAWVVSLIGGTWFLARKSAHPTSNP